MKRLALYTVIVLATLTGFYLLWIFKDAVILFLLSLGAAAAVRPIVDRLSENKIPRALSLVLVYVLFLAILILLIYYFGGIALNELKHLSDRFVMFYDHAWLTWPKGTGLQREIISRLPAPSDFYKAIAGTQGFALAQTFFGATLSSLSFLSQFIGVIVLSIYWSIDQAHSERVWLSLLPAEQRASARDIWRTIEGRVGAYIRTEVIQMLLASLLLGVCYYWIGIPIPVILAIFAGLVWLIPWLGVTLAAIAAFVAGITVNLALGLSGIIVTIIVLLLLRWLIERRLNGTRQYSPFLTVIFVIALADVYGIVGILVAPPLAAAVQVLVSRLTAPRIQSQKHYDIQEIDQIKQRLEAIKTQAAEQEDKLPQQTISIIERADMLINRADDLLT